ncbi:hypothetical protein G3I44_08305 [Halogeometricum borinquense]|uniref:Uncharacterized protein n=1 Tax=Halogeometricum borinquense TaxID=60847 RepID=A0A6C0UIN3_9EURY|nr:hypothetical protein [Halogeometricum borinquense]QIB72798.1 hypothetical protein G3I44_08305 [Halogeometricum borinquense]
MTKQIKVSDAVYDDLDELKDEEGHTSFDSVIRELLTTHKWAESVLFEPDRVFIDPKGDAENCPNGLVTLADFARLVKAEPQTDDSEGFHFLEEE